MQAKPFFFFDRDGVVNKHPEDYYILTEEEFELIPSFIEAMKLLRDHGILSAVVTNQKCVGKGLLSEETLEAIHRKMRDELAKQDCYFIDVIAATDLEDDAPMRKPNPGMLIALAEKHNINLADAWMIGDQERDVIAGKRVGCKTLLINSDVAETVADYHINRIEELPDFLKEQLLLS